MNLVKTCCLVAALLSLGANEPTFALPIDSSTDGLGFSEPASLPPNLQQGFAALKAGDLDAASTKFKQQLATDPNSVSAMFGLAEIAMRKGSKPEAESWISKATRADPKNPKTLAAAGRYFLRTDRADRAEDLYQRALALDDSLLLAHRDLGDLYLHARHTPKKAIISYRKALALDNSNPELHFSLGIALAATGGRNEALSELRTAADLANQNPIPLHTIGRLYAQDKDFDKAIAAFSAALARDSRFLPALSDRADAYIESKNEAAALRDYEAVTQINPGDGMSWMKLGMIYQRTGNSDSAQKAYLKAISLAPDAAPAFNNLAMMELRRNGNLVQARKWCDQAVKVAPSVPHFLDTRAQIAERQGEFAQALADYEAAARLRPPQADILHRLGLAYERAGKHKEALGALQESLKADPKYDKTGDVKAHIEALRARPDANAK